MTTFQALGMISEAPFVLAAAPLQFGLQIPGFGEASAAMAEAAADSSAEAPNPLLFPMARLFSDALLATQQVAAEASKCCFGCFGP